MNKEKKKKKKKKNEKLKLNKKKKNSFVLYPRKFFIFSNILVIAFINDYHRSS